MSGGKITVRQKMINMMYLVLTALLALNVSAEILRAFHMVEVSMDRAAENIDKKNKSIRDAIKKYVEGHANDEKGLYAEKQSQEADKIAKSALKYIGALKQELIAGAGGRKEGKADQEIEESSNIEKHANLLFKFENGAKGLELQKQINDTRIKLINLLPAERRVNVKSDLFANNDPAKAPQTWASEMFEHTPVAAVVALLSKTESDIKNTEAQVLDELNKDITGDVVVVDKFDGKVIPTNGIYITAGSEYAADIFLAASSSRMQAEVMVNGSPINVEDGVGKYKITASGEGEKKYKGVISTKKASGEQMNVEFEAEYTVIKPLAVVSATKMNVVYRAIDNPISISVPGYSANEVQARPSVGALKNDKQPGTYNLMVAPGDQSMETIITVTVKDKSNGQMRKMGEQRYRIKNIPRPTPMLGPIDASGDVTIGKLKAANFVATQLKDFAFEGIKYTPQSWKMVYVPRTGNATVIIGSGSIISPQAKAFLNNARSNDKIILYDIKAVGPQGLVPLTSALVLNVL